MREKVIAAKDYQIRCQRLIAMDAAKKIISETTKDSTNLFNVEATKLTFQYSRILAAMGMSDELLYFDEASIKPILLYFNATRECGSKEKLLEIAMVLCHLREINATAAGMQEVIDICENFEPRAEEDVAP